jgi:Lon protease-like protein
MEESARLKPEPKAAPDLPSVLPLFPLSGVLLLPRGHLPLNVFEPRYIAMVDDALKHSRMIGMIQPRNPDSPADLFRTGCAGRITSFAETEDGRYLITLTGLCRFAVTEELPPQNGYRRARVDGGAYRNDFKPVECLDIDRRELRAMLKEYFTLQDMSCDWEAIDNAPDERLITCLSMICPFDAGEKQALLEAGCCRERAEKFMTMLRMALHDREECCGGCH